MASMDKIEKLAAKKASKKTDAYTRNMLGKSGDMAAAEAAKYKKAATNKNGNIMPGAAERRSAAAEDRAYRFYGKAQAGNKAPYNSYDSLPEAKPSGAGVMKKKK